MTMLINLEHHYRGCGILSTEFSCKHECDCRERPRGRGAYPLLPKNTTAWSKEVMDKFTPARSAYVGELYGVHKGMPRLLILSLDPGSALIKRDPGFNIASDQSRLPEEVRKAFMERMERVRLRRSMATPTLRGMNQMAQRILTEFHKFPTCDWVEAAPYYAHVNAVKCTLNLPSRRKVPVKMFRNCRGYLPGEIGPLKPDVVVTLGDDAEESAACIFEQVGDGIVTLDGRRMFWVRSPHPAVRDGSFKRFLNTDVEPELGRLRRFFSNRRPA